MLTVYSLCEQADGNEAWELGLPMHGLMMTPRQPYSTPRLLYSPNARCSTEDRDQQGVYAFANQHIKSAAADTRLSHPWHMNTCPIAETNKNIPLPPHVICEQDSYFLSKRASFAHAEKKGHLQGVGNLQCRPETGPAQRGEHAG